MDDEKENIDVQDFYAPKPEALEINTASKGYLLEIARWAKLFAILGFILTGFIVFISLFMGSIMRLLADLSAMAPTIDGNENPIHAMGSGISTLVVIVYLLMALLYFFPSYYLYKFAAKMKLGLVQDDGLNVEEGFKNLKSVFKFWGICTVIFLSIYAFMFVIGLLTSLF